MTPVPGKENKPNALGIWPGQDRAGRYTKKCIAFADDYGWTRGFVCSYWSQIAIAREMEAGQARELAEEMAWVDIQMALRDCKLGEGACN